MEKTGRACKKYVFNMALYGLCAAINLYNGLFRGRGALALICGVVWLAGSVLWACRAVKAKQQTAEGTASDGRGGACL